MRHVLRVVWWLLGSMVVLGCVAEDPPTATSVSAVESAPAPDDSANDAIREDDPHLPGSCTNPVACGTTTGVDPNGQGGGTPPAGCYGCDCKATAAARQACHSCSTRCGATHTRCIGSSDNTEACDEIARNCERGCIDNN